MAFDVYQLTDQQVELGYFASDTGKSFNEGKFLRLSYEDFVAKPSGNGIALLEEGQRTGMIRQTKSGAYALVAKQVQQIVSVHSRPDAPQSIVYEEPVYEGFDSEEFDERTVSGTAAKAKEQPVLTYLGAGLSIVALLLSSFISGSGLVGLFTVVLALVGFVMAVIGTIQFFKFAHDGTPKMSKILHVALTVISLFTLLMLGYATFIAGPRLNEQVPNTEEYAPAAETSSTGDVEASETVKLSPEELRETISFEYGQFETGEDATGLLTTGLPITLTNTSDQSWVYNITIQAYNVNGDKVGDPDYLLMMTVEPGETIETMVFEYMTQKEADVLAQDGITFDITDITNA